MGLLPQQRPATAERDEDDEQRRQHAAAGSSRRTNPLAGSKLSQHEFFFVVEVGIV
jgi:hypothetical protein